MRALVNIMLSIGRSDGKTGTERRKNRGKEEKLSKWKEDNQLFKGTSVTFSNFAVTITVDPTSLILRQLNLGLKVTHCCSKS